MAYWGHFKSLTTKVCAIDQAKKKEKAALESKLAVTKKIVQNSEIIRENAHFIGLYKEQIQ